MNWRVLLGALLAAAGAAALVKALLLPGVLMWPPASRCCCGTLGARPAPCCAPGAARGRGGRAFARSACGGRPIFSPWHGLSLRAAAAERAFAPASWSIHQSAAAAGSPCTGRARASGRAMAQICRKVNRRVAPRPATPIFLLTRVKAGDGEPGKTDANRRSRCHQAPGVQAVSGRRRVIRTRMTMETSMFEHCGGQAPPRAAQPGARAR